MRREDRPLQVLVVEDEALIRWALNETLTRAGHHVREAGDAASALRVLREFPAAIDVVLLDLRLPDSSDLSLLCCIRQLSPASAVVMMTAHTTPEMSDEARRLGAFDVMAKPFDVERCERTLRLAHDATRH
jgi:two-component system response regulator PilR (NtrC family)